MKRKLILLGMLTVLSAAVFAQSPQQPGNASGKALTYNWIVPDMKTNQNPMYASSLARHHIQAAFDKALESRGLTRNTQHPDLLLQFHTYTQRVRRNYYGGPPYPMMMGWSRFGWGLPYYGFGGYGGYPYSTTSTDGTLVLDVVDTKSGDIIWQKAISGDVSNPNRLEKQINKGVKKLMKSFPVQQQG
ncbi:DUF4136 domain-containing protein [Dyadobacter sp. 676]|uniref:DUF4136 domain-containing protein n=1 Tax=Dyadobacter sp. 676 TaxID=3088362 RepID=A0AAU8FIP5_9BACT